MGNCTSTLVPLMVISKGTASGYGASAGGSGMHRLSQARLAPIPHRQQAYCRSHILAVRGGRLKVCVPDVMRTVLLALIVSV